MLNKGCVSLKVIVVARMDSDSFCAAVDFDQPGGCADKAALVHIGIMTAVKETGVVNVVVELYFCLFPLCILIFGFRQRLKAGFVNLLKGSLSVAFPLLKRPVDQLDQFFSDRFVNFLQAKKLSIP